MSPPGLTIIGERINPGFARSKALLDARDLDGLMELAVAQAEKGANYLTINVGEEAENDPRFLEDLIPAVQSVVDTPLSFDSPHPRVQETCLKIYDQEAAGSRKPIVNSLSEQRMDFLDLRKIRPHRLVLMVSERVEDGRAVANRTAEEIHQTARRLAERILAASEGFTPDDLLVDVSLNPVASDTEGLTQRSLDAIRLIGGDPDMKGVHLVVGLSNLGIMLPREALDGSRLSVKLESAFLTLAMPLGLDTILGTPGRDYRFLSEDDFVFQGLKEAIELGGFESLMRIQRLYRKEKG